MKLKVGDRVRYLNDVGGGVVSKIISNSMVMLLDDIGFEIPVTPSELMVVEGFQAAEEQRKQDVGEPILPEEVAYIEGNDNPLFVTAFVPHDSKQGFYHIYLINDSNLFANFMFCNKIDNQLTVVAQGIIEPNTKQHLSEYSLEELHQIPEFNFQFIMFSIETFTHFSPIEITYKIPHKKFHTLGSFVENDFFDENALVHNLYNHSAVQVEQTITDQDIERVKSLKDLGTLNKLKQPSVSKVDKETREVDLHIHEIVEDEYGLSAAEKLEIQIQEFESELHKAIKDGIQKIVFIHGVGNGVLKSKICSILKRDYPKYFFQDASFQKYKFGATLVYLRKINK